MAGRSKPSQGAESKTKPKRQRKEPRKRSPGTRERGRTKADAKAKQGGSTPAADAIERGETYRTIYDRWRTGVDVATLSADYELTPRRVQQIVDELRAVNYDATVDVAHPLSALQIVDRLLAQLDAAVGQAALIFEGAIKDKNWAVALGASRRIADARRELLELQQARGIVPRNFAELHNQWDGMQLVSSIFEVFERYDVPEVVSSEIAKLVHMDTRRDRGRLELDMRTGDSEVIDTQAAA
jgi:hypothetical protein